MGEGRVRHTRLTRIGIVLGAGLLIGGCTSGAVAPSLLGSATTSSPAATEPGPTLAAPTPSPSSSSSIGGSPAPVLASTTEFTTEQPAGSVLLEMTGPPPHFVPSKLSATVGDVVFFLKNTSPARDEHGKHDLAIGPDRDHPLAVSDLLDGGRSAVFTVHGLDAGTYVIWCTFPGHAGLGQSGTLTITE
jgi:plastocyanin